MAGLRGAGLGFGFGGKADRVFGAERGLREVAGEALKNADGVVKAGFFAGFADGAFGAGQGSAGGGDGLDGNDQFFAFAAVAHDFMEFGLDFAAARDGGSENGFVGRLARAAANAGAREFVFGPAESQEEFFFVHFAPFAF